MSIAPEIKVPSLHSLVVASHFWRAQYWIRLRPASHRAASALNVGCYRSGAFAVVRLMTRSNFSEPFPDDVVFNAENPVTFHRRNIQRYARLLAGELTELERQYLHKRIAEEQAELERLQESQPQQAGVLIAAEDMGKGSGKQSKFLIRHFQERMPLWADGAGRSVRNLCRGPRGALIKIHEVLDRGFPRPRRLGTGRGSVWRMTRTPCRVLRSCSSESYVNL
jgi:hypothetical protein